MLINVYFVPAMIYHRSKRTGDHVWVNVIHMEIVVAPHAVTMVGGIHIVGVWDGDTIIGGTVPSLIGLTAEGQPHTCASLQPNIMTKTNL